MAAETIFYRLFRLRRLVALAVGPLVLLVLALGWVTGGVSPVLMLITLVPLVHLLVYPTVWMETIAVSVIAAVIILLTAILGEVGVFGLIWRVLWMGLLSVVLLFVVTSPLTMLLSGGEMVEVQSSASRRSSLDAGALRDRITHYPGRSDQKTVCGEADDGGVFTITTYAEMQQPEFHCEELEGLSRDGRMAIEYFGVVKSSGPDHHEVFTFEERDGPVTANRHDFKPLRRGTRVRLSESGAMMPKGQRFGFWVQDFMADYLTDEIDRAEGRAPRTNRSTGHRQLVVDIANVLMRRWARPPIEETEWS